MLRRVEREVLEVPGHRLIVFSTLLLVAVNGYAVPALDKIRQHETASISRAVHDKVCRGEHDMVVCVKDTGTYELMSKPLAGIVFAIPFIVVGIAGIVVATHSIVRQLVAIHAECTKEILVSPIIGGEPRVELRYQLATRRDARIEVGVAIGVGVFNLLRVGQTASLHQEEADSLVGLKIRQGHCVCVGVRSYRNIVYLHERIPGVLVFSFVIRGGGNVERVRDGAASAEREGILVVARLRDLHCRGVVGIDLQKFAKTCAGTSELIDARDVVGGQGAIPKREVVQFADEWPSAVAVVPRSILCEVERTAGVHVEAG